MFLRQARPSMRYSQVADSGGACISVQDAEAEAWHLETSSWSSLKGRWMHGGLLSFLCPSRNRLPSGWRQQAPLHVAHGK